MENNTSLGKIFSCKKKNASYNLKILNKLLQDLMIFSRSATAHILPRVISLGGSFGLGDTH